MTVSISRLCVDDAGFHLYSSLGTGGLGGVGTYLGARIMGNGVGPLFFVPGLEGIITCTVSVVYSALLAVVEQDARVVFHRL